MKRTIGPTIQTISESQEHFVIGEHIVIGEHVVNGEHVVLGEHVVVQL